MPTIGETLERFWNLVVESFSQSVYTPLEDEIEIIIHSVEDLPGAHRDSGPKMLPLGPKYERYAADPYIDVSAPNRAKESSHLPWPTREKWQDYGKSDREEDDIEIIILDVEELSHIGNR